MKSQEHKSNKRIYEKPTLRTIELAAEEVLGSGDSCFVGEGGLIGDCVPLVGGEGSCKGA